MWFFQRGRVGRFRLFAFWGGGGGGGGAPPPPPFLQAEEEFVVDEVEEVEE